MDYIITYSKRKTIGLYVHKDGSIEIRCSKNTPKAFIERFIYEKQGWLNEKATLMKSKAEARNEFKLEFGSSILFLGKEYPILIKEGNEVGFDQKSFFIPPNFNSLYIKNYIIEVYKKLAKKVIINKVIHFSQIIGVNPIAIKINSAKTRWGSCSWKNSLNFSWLLVMAEESVIDYVVVHELSHIKQHNHSLNFWKEVEKIIPNYKFEQLKLKKLQKKLSNENWDEA
jgi:predicted metal-dependent hydrolase